MIATGERMLLEMSAEDYYSDPCDTPSLTQSTAHTLLTKSPYHAWMYHPKLGNIDREATADMDRGTILHDCIFCGGMSPNVVILPFDNYRTKAAQEERDGAKERGKTPILERELGEFTGAAIEIRKRIESMGISLDGQFEAVVIWTEIADDGTEVKCRGRLDLWRSHDGTILDLKTCTIAHPAKCVKAMLEYGGDIQRAAYTSAIEWNFPDLAGRVEFINLFAEFQPPYFVTPIRHGGSMKELGKLKWRRAINKWAECLRRNEWPGYVTDIIEVSAPQWAISAEHAVAFDEE